MPKDDIIRAALKAQTSFCHSKYFSFTQPPIPKSQENRLTEVAIFAISINFWAIFEKFSHSDAAKQNKTLLDLSHAKRQNDKSCIEGRN